MSIFELGEFYSRGHNDTFIEGKYMATPHNANQSGIWNKILKNTDSNSRNTLTKYLSDWANNKSID